MIPSIINKWKFDKNSDRLGPDLPFTHWRLFLKKEMEGLCKKKFSHFGENSEFRPYAYAINCSKISIGRNVVIRPGTMLFADSRFQNDGMIIIEDNALIGSGVHIYTANHEFRNLDKDIYYQGHQLARSVTIHHGCWIGANAVILPGVNIGRNSVVGAGSVVTKDVPERTVFAGSPAKLIKKI
jgi:acetyltransferase-like isoleucine patch superfamily enzyme